MAGSSIRTFNSAKKFAEEVLHPLIRSHTDAKLCSKLGALNDEEAIKISPNMRVIKRFNAMKERITLLDGLIMEVEPTIRLNGRVGEIGLIEELKEQLHSIEDDYNDSTEDLLEVKNVNGVEKPVLTDLFKQVGYFLDRIYVQLQRLMTKNKLLFYGEDNEYLEDEQLKEKIKLENRQA